MARLTRVVQAEKRERGLMVGDRPHATAWRGETACRIQKTSRWVFLGSSVGRGVVTGEELGEVGHR